MVVILMENRLKTKIDGKLKLSSIIQTVIDYSIPETEIILDNFSDYSDYDLFLFFTMDSGNGDYNTNRFDVKSGKCLVKTLDLLNAKKLSYFIRNKNVPSVNTTVSIDLTEYRHNAQVFENKDTKIIVYCRSGNRSATAAQTLIDLGYKNVYDLGGINNCAE